MKLTPSGVLKFAQETVNTPRIDDLGRKIYDKVGYIEFPDKTRTYEKKI